MGVAQMYFYPLQVQLYQFLIVIKTTHELT